MYTSRWVCDLMCTHSLSYWTHTSHLKIRIRTLRGFRGDTNFWSCIMVTTRSKQLRTNWTRYIIYTYIVIQRYQTVCSVMSLFVKCKWIEMCVWSRCYCAREFGKMRFARRRRTSRYPRVWNLILMWNAPSGNSPNVILPGIWRSVPFLSLSCCPPCDDLYSLIWLWFSELLSYSISLELMICVIVPSSFLELWSFWGVGLSSLAPCCPIWILF